MAEQEDAILRWALDIDAGSSAPPSKAKASKIKLDARKIDIAEEGDDASAKLTAAGRGDLLLALPKNSDPTDISDEDEASLLDIGKKIGSAALKQAAALRKQAESGVRAAMAAGGAVGEELPGAAEAVVAPYLPEKPGTRVIPQLSEEQASGLGLPPAPAEVPKAPAKAPSKAAAPQLPASEAGKLGKPPLPPDFPAPEGAQSEWIPAKTPAISPPEPGGTALAAPQIPGEKAAETFAPPKPGVEGAAPPETPEASFDRALKEAATGALGAISASANVIPASPDARQAITEALQELGAQAAPEVVDFVASIDAKHLSLQPTVLKSGEAVPPAKTLGQVYDEAQQALSVLRLEAEKKLQVDAGMFDSRSDFQQFLKDAAQAGEQVGLFARDIVIPESPEMASLNIGLLGLGPSLSLLNSGKLNARGATKFGALIREMALAGDFESMKRLAVAEAAAAQEAKAGAKTFIRATLSALKSQAAKRGGKLTAGDIEVARMKTSPLLPEGEVRAALESGDRDIIELASELETPVPGRWSDAMKKIQGLMRKKQAASMPPGKAGVPPRAKPRAGEIPALVKATKEGGGSDFFNRMFREPRKLIASWGAAGQRFVDMIDGWDNATAKVAGAVSEGVRGALKDVPEKLRDEYIGPLLDQARRKSVNLKKLSAKEQKIVTDAVKKIRASFRPLIEYMEKHPSDFLDEEGRFNSGLFNTQNLFYHYYDFDNPKVRESLAEGVTKYLRNNPLKDQLIKANSRPSAPDRFVEARENIVKELMKAGRKGRLAFPEELKFLGEINAPGYATDTVAVLDETAKAWARRAAKTEFLGARDARIKAAMRELTAAGRPGKYINDVYTSATIGHLPEPGVRSAVNAATWYNVITKMGLSPLRNATQPANTAARYGFANTARAMADYKSKFGDEKFFDAIDSIVGGAMRDGISQATGISAKALEGDAIYTRFVTGEQMLKFNKFLTVERFNRLISAAAARFYVKDEVAALIKSGANSARGQLASVRLREFLNDKQIAGLVKSGGKLTADLEKDIAIRAIRNTQFSTGVLDTPLYWQTDVGRMAFQFMNIPFRQGVMVRDILATASPSDKAAIMARLGAAGTMVGIPVQSINDFLTGKQYDDILAIRVRKAAGKVAISEGEAGKAELAANLFEGLTASVGLGFPLEVAASLMPEAFGRKAYSRADVTGPTLSDVALAAAGVKNLLSKPEGAKERATKAELESVGRFALPRALPLAAAATAGIPGIGRFAPAATAVTAAGSRGLSKALFPPKKEKGSGERTPAFVELYRAAARRAMGQ